VIVDTGATYTVLDKKTANEVGAWRIPFEIHLELGDGRIVKASMYAIIVRWPRFLRTLNPGISANLARLEGFEL